MNYRVFFFTGSALKVLSMELVPPNREMTGASSACMGEASVFLLRS